MSNIFSLSGARLFGGRHPQAEVAEHPHVVVETLGREHSGKTGARAMTFKTVQAGPLPSGLGLAAADPRAASKLMNEAIATYRGLQKSGFTSTIDPTQSQYHLFESDRLRAVYSHRESVGQLLTFTQESDKRLNRPNRSLSRLKLNDLSAQEHLSGGLYKR